MFLFLFFVSFIPLSLSQVSNPPLKVLFLENALLEHAWTYRHDVGRFLVAEELRESILTSVEVADEWNDENSIAIITRYIEDGFKMIITTSSGWIGVAQQMAEQFPDVSFVQNPGWNFTADNPALTNLVGVDSQLYQGYYLSGIIAGYMSKTMKIGLLNGQPGIAITQNAANAYCVGAQKVNPNITCHQLLMGEWTDPRKHRQGSQQLMEFGCDHVISVTGNYQPSYVVAEAYAEGNEVYSCGFADDFRVKAGPTVTCSALYFWDEVYTAVIVAKLEGRFNSVNFARVGFSNQGVDVAPPSDLVPSEALPLFNFERERLINSTAGEELVFCGEQALVGLPPDVAIDTDTGCLTPDEVGSMGYQMGYVETIEPDFYWVYVYVEKGDPEYIALMVVISVMVGLSLIYFGVALYFWDTPVIRVSSPLFLMVIFFGALLQFVASYLYLQRPSDGICMAPLWLEMIGLQIMITAICVKNYRMYLLFRHSSKFFPVQISNWELLSVLTLGVLGIILILIGFQVSEPYEPREQPLPPEENPNFDQAYLYCGSDDEALFIGLLWGYLSVWLLVCVVLAYLTRKLEGVFCESNDLALAIYNIVIIELIFLPLIYTFELDQYQGKTLLLSIQPMYRAITTLSFLLIPKFILAIFHPEENITKRGSKSSPSGTDVDG
mmetsp:Transcript_9839/g.13232  ORF Transcript_9839/g.13232 Transcript_9839/m.13232 type:complete len:666 (+) Transcript_9839:67-2064(+)